jgi:hypothetical protein
VHAKQNLRIRLLFLDIIAVLCIKGAAADPSLILEGPISTKHPDIFKVKWRLKNFASLRENSYRSPIFKVSGVPWNVLIYPRVINAT